MRRNLPSEAAHAEFESAGTNCKDILEPPSSLDEAADELWGGVTRRDGVFDGTQREQRGSTVSKKM